MEGQNTNKRLLWKDLKEKDLAIQLGLINNHLEIARMFINELLEEELIEKTGRRYQRKKTDYVYRRWSSNPGSVKVGSRKLKIIIPRIVHKASGKVESLSRYKELREQQETVGIPVPVLKSIGKGIAKAARKRTEDFLSLAQMLWNEYGREGRVATGGW